ncbi:TPA: hypothetical protein ACHY7U_002759 [Escherichia coli]
MDHYCTVRDSEMQNVAPDGKGIRLELIGFRGNETIPDTLH